MSNLKEPNVYDIFQIRQVEFLPKHFEAIEVQIKYNLENSLKKWILNNLKGRFYLGTGIALIDNNVSSVLKVGFENSKEMSYFVLACPLLKYK